MHSPRVSARPAVVAFAALLALLPASAFGYVQTRVRSGAGMHWEDPTRTLSLVTSGPAGFTDDEYADAIGRAADAWGPASIPCSGVSLSVARAAGEAKVALDGRNVVAFRSSQWCRINAADPKGPLDCSPTSMLALTTVFADVKTGRILEADIEINGVKAQWGNVGSEPSDAYDLQNAITHELGHFLGFAHSCSSFVDNALEVDDHGAPLGSCGVATAEQMASTMFPRSDSGDIQMRTLSADDQRGVCEVYPSRAAALASADDATFEGGGCSYGGQTGAPPALALLVGAVVFVFAAKKSTQKR